MIVSDILTSASRLLFDESRVRWTTAELIDYINDAQRVIVTVRPDAAPVTETVQLVGGSRQSLPAGAIRLIRAVRNRSALLNGSAGAAIRFVSRDTMDEEDPNWHVSTPSTTVKHYMTDAMEPLAFYVWPPVSGTIGANATAFIDIVYSKVPTKIASTATTATLTLPDQYFAPVLDWVLYRAFSKDASYGGDLSKAQMHLSAFQTVLQVGGQSEAASIIPIERQTPRAM
jgi:hypothetical protein